MFLADVRAGRVRPSDRPLWPDGGCGCKLREKSAIFYCRRGKKRRDAASRQLVGPGGWRGPVCRGGTAWGVPQAGAPVPARWRRCVGTVARVCPQGGMPMVVCRGRREEQAAGGRGCAEQAPMSARARRHGAARRCGPMGVVPRRVCFVPVALSARAVCVRVSFWLSEVQFGSRLEAHYFLGRDFDGLSV